MRIAEGRRVRSRQVGTVLHRLCGDALAKVVCGFSRHTVRIAWTGSFVGNIRQQAQPAPPREDRDPDSSGRTCASAAPPPARLRNVGDPDLSGSLGGVVVPKTDRSRRESCAESDPDVSASPTVPGFRPPRPRGWRNCGASPGEPQSPSLSVVINERPILRMGQFNCHGFRGEKWRAGV